MAQKCSESRREGRMAAGRSAGPERPAARGGGGERTYDVGREALASQPASAAPVGGPVTPPPRRPRRAPTKGPETTLGGPEGGWRAAERLAAVPAAPRVVCGWGARAAGPTRARGPAAGHLKGCQGFARKIRTEIRRGCTSRIWLRKSGAQHSAVVGHGWHCESGQAARAVRGAAQRTSPFFEAASAAGLGTIVETPRALGG